MLLITTIRVRMWYSVNPWDVGAVYIRNAKLVITVFADDLDPYGDRSLSSTVMIVQCDLFSFFRAIIAVCGWADDVMQNILRDLEKIHDTSSV